MKLKKFLSLLLSLFILLSALPAAAVDASPAPAAYTDGPIDGLEAEHRLDDGLAEYDGTIDSSACIVLIDASTGAVLFEQNPRRRAYPASTTKIMSTLIAIESGDLERLITVGSEVNIGSGWSTMTPALKPGETISLIDMIYGAMLPSGCEASAAIGVSLGGSTSAFAEWMNRRALALGMTGTHFVNANGMTDSDHYTTAMDLMRLCRAAMRNETFRTVCSTRRYITAPTNKYGERTLTNTNYLLDSSSGYYYPFALGIKTGTTSQAKYCLTAYAEKDGRGLMLVILRAPTDSARYGYARDLFNWGFSEGFTSGADAFFDSCAPVNEVMALASSAAYYYSPAASGEYYLGTATGGTEFLIEYSAQNEAGELWYFTGEGYFIPASAFVYSSAPINWGYCADCMYPLPAGEHAGDEALRLRGTVFCDRFIESVSASAIDPRGLTAAHAEAECFSTYFDLVRLEGGLFSSRLPGGSYTLVITCRSGQSEYTLESEFSVTALPVIPGDVDCDGMLTFTDVSALSLFLIGSGGLPYGADADYNRDGEVNFLDLADMYIALLG